MFVQSPSRTTWSYSWSRKGVVSSYPASPPVSAAPETMVIHGIKASP